MLRRVLLVSLAVGIVALIGYGKRNRGKLSSLWEHTYERCRRTASSTASTPSAVEEL